MVIDHCSLSIRSSVFSVMSGLSMVIDHCSLSIRSSSTRASRRIIW